MYGGIAPNMCVSYSYIVCMYFAYIIHIQYTHTQYLHSYNIAMAYMHIHTYTPTYQIIRRRKTLWGVF